MKVTYIELANQRYPLCFSLAASEKLSAEFGGLANIQSVMQSGSESDAIRAIDRILTILMDAGLIYQEACGEPVPLKLPCRPADLLDAQDPTVVRTILDAIIGDTEREVEVDTKNGEAARES